MEGLSNHYITSILEPACIDFRGVFSANTIPVQLLKCETYALVCNLSNAGERGTHFVAIIVKRNRVLYLDSLGLPCVVPQISGFLKRLNKPVFYNSQQIQHSSSKFCGFYCILFVLYFCKPTTTPLLFETEELLLNDATCVEKICELLNK